MNSGNLRCQEAVWQPRFWLAELKAYSVYSIDKRESLVNGASQSLYCDYAVGSVILLLV